MLKKIIQIIIPALLLVSCTSPAPVPDFPLHESPNKKAIIKPVHLSVERGVSFQSPGFSTKPVVVGKFDLRIQDPKNINTGEYQALTSPVQSSNINLQNLPAIKFDLKKLKDVKAVFKTSLVGYPKRINTLAPVPKPGASENVLLLDTDNGLPGKVCSAVLEDKHGLLWISTDNGLCRYDGENMDVYTVKQGLSYNYTTALLQDRKGNLWIGTSSGGVNIFNPETGIINTLNVERGLSNNVVSCLKEDKKGRVWIGTRNGGVNVFDPETGMLKTINKKEGLSDNTIIAIEEHSDGTIWLATLSHGVNIWSEHNQTIRFLDERSGVFNSVQVLHFSAPDKMYIGSNEGGLVVLSTLSGKMNFWGSRQGLSDHIKSLYLEDNTKLWLGYDNGDADIVDLNNNTVKHLNTSKVFNNNALCHITKTSGGVVFLSSIGFGLGEYAPEHCDLNFISIEDGLNSNTVWGLLQDSKGNIWVGSENGINVISATDKKNYSLPGYDVVETIMEDKKGNVWFGCTGGTFRIRSTDGVIEQFLVNPEDMLQRTCVLYEDSRGWIWMGKNEGGLNVYNPETGEMSLLSKADGLPGNKVRNIREGKDGKMWLGTLGNGMAIYDPEKKTLQQLNERNGLCNNNVLELLIDKDSLIWIGTYGGGVDVYNPRNGLIANYSLEQGIADATINSILEKNGRFYLGTGLGLYVMEKQGMRNGEPEFSVTAYGRTQGFSSTDYNTNSELLTRNGQLWWGIGDYLTIMKEPKKNLLAPETKITAIDLGGGLNRFYTDAFIKEALKQHDTLWFQEKDTFYTWQQPVHIQNQAAGKHVTWESIAPPWFIPQHLVLPYGNNEIGISFTGLQFDNIDKTVYRYFLHGQDTGWSEMTTRAQVSYSNLLAGDYTFYVCSRSFDGVWSKPASFSFAVSLPWWQTKLAYTLYLAILIGVITGYNRLKTLQLRNRQKVLEEIIALHTEKVVTQKEEIEKHRAKILESINYARHIQSSILDDKENIGKSIGEAFILFRPLEIVSGDFYWYYRKDDYSIIACIDCTGHGVPGAFMSMIGSMLLNAIVKEQGVVEPGEIMKRLHAGVVSALHQETIEKSQEGMELALCTINHQSGKMRFCGARSAIYVMNKDGLKRYKSGLLPIGGMYMKKGRAMDLKFESLEIELDEHTWVYMSTDGFPDQFGGNQRDSFTFGRMETSIKEAYPKNANEQEKFFSDTLNKWMQGSIQNDDILLLGFRAKLG